MGEGLLWERECWGACWRRGVDGGSVVGKRGSGEVFQGEELADEGGPDRLLEDN